MGEGTNPEDGALGVGKLPGAVASLHTGVFVCPVLTERVLLLGSLKKVVLTLCNIVTITVTTR